MSGLGNVSRLLSSRYANVAKLWVPTAGAFGAAATLAFLYATEWKLVLQYVPVYNSKFKEDENK